MEGRHVLGYHGEDWREHSDDGARRRGQVQRCEEESRRYSILHKNAGQVTRSAVEATCGRRRGNRASWKGCEVEGGTERRRVDRTTGKDPEEVLHHGGTVGLVWTNKRMPKMFWSI